MPALPNARHEAFVRGLALGKTADKAYEDAGYKRNRFNAARLKTKEHIAKRLNELNNGAAKKVTLDKAWVLERLMKNARIAMGEEKITLSTKDGEEVATTDRDVSGANRALELLGKELGMFIERSESVNTNYNISDKPMNEDDWAEEYAESSDAVH
jgi:hypothetical protein